MEVMSTPMSMPSFLDRDLASLGRKLARSDSAPAKRVSSQCPKRVALSPGISETRVPTCELRANSSDARPLFRRR